MLSEDCMQVKITYRDPKTKKLHTMIEDADAKYKIAAYSEHELVIPEHPDITLEVDKLLSAMAEAEDKLAVMELHYDGNVAVKKIL